MVQNLVFNSSCNTHFHLNSWAEMFISALEGCGCFRAAIQQSICVYQTVFVCSAPVICLGNKGGNGK